jgi:hypothetical protein
MMWFIIGGTIGWFILSMFYGRLLPVFSWQTFVAIFIGGIIGTGLEGVFSKKKYGVKS